MNKKNSGSRVETEAREGLDTVNNQVPELKLQKDQQIADTDSALNTKTVNSSFTAKKEKLKGATLKQQAIADVITGSSIADGMGINAAGRGVSGTSGGILGANNSTPVATKSRSESRIGKKFDRLANKLNYTPSEQIIVAVDESKPLADASDADQGYNGTYRNETARSQKVMGAVPGDLMFQRSVDLLTKDKLYFVEGQQIFQDENDKLSLNPTKSKFNEYIDTDHTVRYKSGNYLHHDLRFGLNNRGKVKYFFSNCDDLTSDTGVDSEIANVSSAHRLIKSNVAELDRQVMDSKAGDEKADKWSPLGRAIAEPTAAAYLMSSFEADTGAYTYLAYSKAGTNMSYQLNRGPKDGLNEVTPAIEQCIGWRASYTDSSDITSDYSNLQAVFNSDDYDKGDPSLMIAAYDSHTKYKNKADLLLQPRGFRMHLQTADNNMNPLKVPAEFANVFSGQEVFSTIDHEYDPILPICMTDKANLITVHNFNEFSSFILSKYTMKYESAAIEEGYSYKTEVLIPKGAVKALGYSNLYIYQDVTGGDGLDTIDANGFIAINPDSSNGEKTIIINITTEADSKNSANLIATIPANYANDVVLKIPTVQKATEDNDTVVTSVSFDDIETNDKIYYNGAGPYSYAYSDLRNEYIIDVKHPLIDGIISYIDNAIGGKFRSLLGNKHELFVPLVFSTQYMTLAQLLILAATPFITRVRINSMKDVIYYEENFGEYPYSKLRSIKEVPFHNYLNFTFSGYDEPLQTRVMNPTVAISWVMPEFFWKVGTGKYVLPWYFNENEFRTVSAGKVDLDMSAMSFPSIRSGIRMGALDIFYGMSEKDVRLSLDRLTKQILLQKNSVSTIKVYKYGANTDGQPYVELNNSDVFSVKEVMSCPRELGLCMDAPAGVFMKGNTVVDLSVDCQSSMTVKIWVNNNTVKEPQILNRSGVNISRGANFVQKWMALSAASADTNATLAGLVFGMNDEGSASFKPFAAPDTGTQYSGGPSIISLQRSLWTRLQLLPFVISPFDGHVNGQGSVRDIYDVAYMLGLCGFRASDYRESVYNREKEVINQGLLFVDDPWVLDSPIMKGSASSTGVSDNKGYEIRRS